MLGCSGTILFQFRMNRADVSNLSYCVLAELLKTSSHLFPCCVFCGVLVVFFISDVL